LGDLIDAGGGASKGASLKVKGKVYRARIYSVWEYVNETMAMKVDDMARWQRTE